MKKIFLPMVLVSAGLSFALLATVATGSYIGYPELDDNQCNRLP